MTKTKRFIIHGLVILLFLLTGLTVAFENVYADQSVAVNAKNFPDPVFQNYILKYIDKDNNKILSQEERGQVEEIDFDLCGDGKSALKDLTGIAYFPNLWRLSCYLTGLRKLDLSKNTKLVSLNCSQSTITALNVKNCSDLEELYCDSNAIANLDLSDNKKLRSLYCYINQLKQLDLHDHAQLERCYCYSNNLESINVSGCLSLMELHCSDNKLKSLNRTGCSQLEVIDSETFGYYNYKHQEIQLDDNVRCVLEGDTVTLKGSGVIKREMGCWSYLHSCRTIVIDEGFTSIQDHLFSHGAYGGGDSLKHVTKIVLPSTLKSIGAFAFDDSENLKVVDFSNASVKIGNSAFTMCRKLGKLENSGNITEIGQYAFSNCNSLKELTIPGGITKIGDLAFAYSGIKTLTINEGVEEIGIRAFEHCDQLQRVNLPLSLTKIGTDAFDGCEQLTIIDIPQSVDTIEDYALGFKKTNVSASSGLSSFAVKRVKRKKFNLVIRGKKKTAAAKYAAKFGFLFVTDLNYGHKFQKNGLKYHIIKDGTVKLIGLTRKIKHIRIPNTVSYKGKTYKVCAVKSSAFKGNTSIKSLTIGSNVTEIGESAFYKCTGLKKAVFGKNLKKIGRKCFYRCKKLTLLVFKGKKLKSTGKQAFKYTNKKLKIKCPAKVKKKYKKMIH